MIYEEKQVFRNTFVWFTILFLDVAILTPLAFGWVRKVFYDIPFGSGNISDLELSILLLVCMIVMGHTTWLTYSSELYTRVDKLGIHVSYPPYFKAEKNYIWPDILSAEIRQYNPKLDYIGWGIQIGLFSKGKAYNILGNKGLQLTLANEGKLLIGTQKPEELKKAIEALKPLTLGDRPEHP